MSRKSIRKDIQVEGYERVLHIVDEETGLDAFMAIHNTKLGPAIGGIRLYEYKSEEDHLNDALRLAKGMTFKNAAAGINHGGAKTAVNASKIKDRQGAYRLLGKMVNLLDGSYICAGDVGTTKDDLMDVNFGTSYVAGITLDSSLPTALGTKTSIEALLHFNKRQIADTSFTIQGLGKVGWKLAMMLIEGGGDVRAYDPHFDKIYKEFEHQVGDNIITDLSASAIFTDDSDMFVPCALGGVLNMKTLNTMTQKLVCGSANNQFDNDASVAIAKHMGIQYVPDFVANCGGVVAVAYDFTKKDYNKKLTSNLYETVMEILTESKETGFAPQMIAESIANQRINNEYR